MWFQHSYYDNHKFMWYSLHDCVFAISSNHSYIHMIPLRTYIDKNQQTNARPKSVQSFSA